MPKTKECLLLSVFNFKSSWKLKEVLTLAISQEKKSQTLCCSTFWYIIFLHGTNKLLKTKDQWKKTEERNLTWLGLWLKHDSFCNITCLIYLWFSKSLSQYLDMVRVLLDCQDSQTVSQEVITLFTVYSSSIY